MRPAISVAVGGDPHLVARRSAPITWFAQGLPSARRANGAPRPHGEGINVREATLKWSASASALCLR